MQTLWQDLRYGARGLRKQPCVAFIAALTLALGIGVNTAIVSAVSSLLLRPSPYASPEKLAIVFTGGKQQPRVYDDFSYLNYLDYRDRNQSFSGLIAYRMTSAAISNTGGGSDDRAEVVWGETVSGNYFDVLGAPPGLGGGFRPEEDRTPDTHPVVVLGHGLWRRRFNADPAIVGRSVYLNGRPFTVIGVAAEQFTGTKFLLRMEFWVPLMMRSQLISREIGADEWRTDRANNPFGLMGRLKPGVTIGQAEADLSLIAQELEKSYPQANAGAKVQVVTEREGRLNDAFPVMRLSSLMALAVVGLVLLIACVNVANLLLARAAARAREIGTRLSLGAGRVRIVRQLMTESMLLSLMGGASGLLLAYWSADLLNATIPPMPYVVELNFAPDRLTLLWATGISLLTSVIFGLAPALSASRADLVAVVKGAGSSPGYRRLSLRNLLIVAQLAVSVVVLVCAGLLLRSLRNAQTTDLGFNVENLVSMQLDPELLGYSVEDGKRFYAELARRVASLPGVASATVTQVAPLSDSGWSRGPLIKEGDAPPPPNQGLYVHYSSIGVRYFETMGTRLLLGRDFNEHDGAGAPQVVIINQELARRLYGGAENALGKRFHLEDASSPPFEIVGVAEDGKYRNLYEDQRPYMFLANQQRYYVSQSTLMARAQSPGALQTVAEGMRREAQRLDPRLPVFDLKTARQHMSLAYWAPQLGAGLSLVSGLLALALAVMGLYGVMNYAVSRRTKEIGVRMALGAQPRDALRLIVRQGMSLVVVGLACGAPPALALGRVLASLLLGVGSADPITFVGVVILLALTALVACLIPARRAAKVDPMIALRHD